MDLRVHARNPAALRRTIEDAAAQAGMAFCRTCGLGRIALGRKRLAFSRQPG